MDSNWPVILKLGVSLSVAALGIHLWNNQEYLLKLFRDHYSNAKCETQKTIKTTIDQVENCINIQSLEDLGSGKSTLFYETIPNNKWRGQGGNNFRIGRSQSSLG